MEGKVRRMRERDFPKTNLPIRFFRSRGNPEEDGGGLEVTGLMKPQNSLTLYLDSRNLAIAQFAQGELIGRVELQVNNLK